MTRLLRRSGVTLAPLTLLAACASLTVADTVPLTPSAMDAARAATGSPPAVIGWMRSPSPGATPDLSVLVAMSGGGKRIRLPFGHGALQAFLRAGYPAVPTAAARNHTFASLTRQ